MKKKVEIKKVLYCEKCKRTTAHVIEDFDKELYKCVLCGKIHKKC